MTFINLLQILLIGLKVTGFIHVSWFIVMLPFIILTVLTIFVVWVIKNK